MMDNPATSERGPRKPAIVWRRLFALERRLKIVEQDQARLQRLLQDLDFRTTCTANSLHGGT
jgi:hypothetical protein